ncbi:MAG: class I SAM-dependent methyltransferase, partial [Candidatus Aenigmatarchaeota archaeon]
DSRAVPFQGLTVLPFPDIQELNSTPRKFIFPQHLYSYMNEQKLYRNLAKYYDLIYHDKDYEGEVERVEDLISEYKRTEGSKLLDVGCGSGGHLKYLKEDFACTGMDVNEGILERAREKVEGVDFIQGDMTDFSLDEKFDVITCLFSSIGYVKTKSKLGKTLNNFYRHLKEGGVVIIEPWFDESSFNEGNVDLKIYENDDVKVIRASMSTKEGKQSVIKMHYVIARGDVGIEHHREEHRMGLFDVDETLELVEKTGFYAEYLEEGLRDDGERGVFVGVKV